MSVPKPRNDFRLYLCLILIAIAFMLFALAEMNGLNFGYRSTEHLESPQVGTLSAAPQPVPTLFVGEIRAFAFGGHDLKVAAAIENLHRNGWMECDGRDHPTKKYGELAAVVGAWGSDSPGQTFKSPDLQGVFLRGVQFSGKLDAGPRQNYKKNGATDGVGSFEADSYASHRHEINQLQVYGKGDAGGGAHIGTSVGMPQKLVTADSGSSETRPKNVAVAYFVYAGRPVTD